MYYFVLFVILLLNIIHVSSPSLTVCPMDKENAQKDLIQYRTQLLCDNTFNSTSCVMHQSLTVQLKTNTFIILHNGEWDLLKLVLQRMDYCNVNYLLYHITQDGGKTTDLSTFCSPAKYYVVLTISTLFDDIYFNLRARNNNLCSNVQFSTQNWLVHSISNSCPMTLWVTGYANCTKSMFNVNVFKIINYNQTYPQAADLMITRDFIRNKHLTIGIVFNAPYIVKKGNNSYEGVLIEMLKEVAKRLHFTYQLREAPDLQWGVFKNGEWNGLIKMIIANESDIAVADLTMTYARSLVVDFSSEFYFETNGILLWKPELKSNIWSIISMFSRGVWLGFLVCCIVALFLLWILHKYSAIHLNCYLEQPLECVWFLYSCIVGQGHNIKPLTWSAQHFMVTWWLFVTVLISVYSGGLIAELTTSHLAIPFKDLEGLSEAVRQGRYKVCVENGTAMYQAIMSDDPKYIHLKTFLQRYPTFIGNHNCEELLLKHKDMIYIDDRSTLVQLQTAQCSNNSFILLGDEFFPGFFAFAFPKASLYNSIISKVISEIVANGLLEEWKNNFSSRSGFCELVKPDDVYKASSESVYLAQFAGPLLIYTIGAIISCFTFAIETSKLCYPSAFVAIFKRNRDETTNSRRSSFTKFFAHDF